MKKAYITHDLNIIRARKIIEEISKLGSFETELQPENQSIDIRDITKAEVIKYRNKFLLSFSLYIPMLFLIWVIPYVDALKPFMTSVELFNGVTLYVFIAFCCSTIIQFYMGQSFYVSAYKSLKHKSANMDVLIVIGTSSAWLYGMIRMIMGYSEAEKMNVKQYQMQVHGHVHNFETASILITIVIGGKLIESYSKMKTVDQLSNLA
jgi:Cu+-exporting ATPase